MIFRSSSYGLASPHRPACICGVFSHWGVSIFKLGIASESRGIYVATVLVRLEHCTLQNYKPAALYLGLLIAFVIPAVLVQELLGAGSPMTFIWQVLSLQKFCMQVRFRIAPWDPSYLALFTSSELETKQSSPVFNSEQCSSNPTRFKIHGRRSWSYIKLSQGEYPGCYCSAVIPFWRRSERSETAIPW